MPSRSRGWSHETPAGQQRADQDRRRPDPDEWDLKPGDPDWPPELRRCTCGIPSYDAQDHANGCPLGTQRLNSSHPGIGW